MKLRQAPTPGKSKRGSDTRREALEVKLKKGSAAPNDRQSKKTSMTRREALEVKLKTNTERQPEVPVGQEESKEALAQLEQLRRVPSNQRVKSDNDEERQIRLKRSSMIAMRRRASSLLEMAGGLKPSLLKAKDRAADRGSISGGDGSEMVAFVTTAHANLKHALAAQQAELARIEAEMEAERLAAEARAEAERKAAERKERKAMLEKHLQRQQEVRQQAKAEADMRAEAERLAAEEEAARIEAQQRAHHSSAAHS